MQVGALRRRRREGVIGSAGRVESQLMSRPRLSPVSYGLTPSRES